MTINTRIPGWNGKEILSIISKYSSQVSPSANILELGALFGRTTYTIGTSKPESACLHTIDIWPNLHISHINQILDHDELAGDTERQFILRLIDQKTSVLSGEDFYSLWKLFTESVRNLKGYRLHTDTDTSVFPSFELIIHDAAHDYTQVYKDLVRWFPKLTNNGVMIIDDYEDDQFPGVVQAVDQYVLEHDLVCEMVTNRNILLKRRT